MAFAFTLEEYQTVVRYFAEQLPKFLAQSTETTDLALAVERLQIADALDQRFSVAVVGQMRAGKPTLLHALLARDLAPTGIIETTATVNWFRWDAGPRTQLFRVHFRDGSQSELPLAEIGPWLHQGDQVARTRCLDFFSDAEFLSTVNLVDTPGTRSTLDTHESAVQRFVEQDAALACERRTLDAGGRADAVL